MHIEQVTPFVGDVCVSTCPLRLSYVCGHVSQTHIDTHMHQNAKWYDIHGVSKITQTKMAPAVRILKRATSCPARYLRKHRYKVLRYNFPSAVERASMADARVQDKGTVDGRHCWNWRTCSPTALQVYADAEVCLFNNTHIF